jgi:hypothetical protein
VSSILKSTGPLLLVIPDKPKAIQLSVALRLVENLHMYFDLDAEIIFDSDAIRAKVEGKLGGKNIISIGSASSRFIHGCLQNHQGGFNVTDSGATPLLTINHRTLRASEGALGMLPLIVPIEL